MPAWDNPSLVGGTTYYDVRKRYDDLVAIALRTPTKRDPEVILDKIGHTVKIGDLVMYAYSSSLLVSRVLRITKDDVHTGLCHTVPHRRVAKLPDTPETTLYILTNGLG